MLGIYSLGGWVVLQFHGGCLMAFSLSKVTKSDASAKSQVG